MGVFAICKTEIDTMMKLIINTAFCFTALCLLCCNNGNNNSSNAAATTADSTKIETKQQGKEISKDANKPKKNKPQLSVETPYNDYLIGKTVFSKDSGFVKLNPAYCDNRTVYLRIRVAEAFEKMRVAAKKDGITLIVLSGSRSFEQQKNIWEKKWNNLKNLAPKERALKVLQYSSMPMSSRHHWGTDIDLNSLDNNYFKSGQGLKIYNWLTENAPKYGFCQVYTDKKNGRTGYEMEKWHWSYMPLSRQVLERYNKRVKITDFKGFSGSEMADTVNVIKNYVNGIEDCECNDDI
jgi:LAS superfamily LD-carboxypeptidase LdcB